MLAIMMLFGALSVSASAADGPSYQGKVVNSNQTIIHFNFNGGSATNPDQLWVYDALNGFQPGTDISGSYYMLPQSDDELVAGYSRIYLPAVKAPSDTQVCAGWQLESQFLSDVGMVYGAGGASHWDIPAAAAGKIVKFTAIFTATEGEGDTLQTILGVLTKVFGTILGLFLFDGSSAKGIELVNGLLSNLL